jgi:hypothetical protein
MTGMEFLKKYWVLLLVILLLVATVGVLTFMLVTSACSFTVKYGNRFFAGFGTDNKREDQDQVRIDEESRVQKINDLNQDFVDELNKKYGKDEPEVVDETILVQHAKRCQQLCHDDPNCKSWELCPWPSRTEDGKSFGFDTKGNACLGCYNFKEKGSRYRQQGFFAGNKK